MPNANSKRIADILAQAHAQRLVRPYTQEQAQQYPQDEPGLESPVEQRLLENANIAASGYQLPKLGIGVAKALATRGLPAMQALGEAGAIFPEGTSLTGVSKESAKELEDLLTNSQMNYRRNEALANWHAKNYDFPRVLQDKWAMLVNHHGS